MKKPDTSSARPASDAPVEIDPAHLPDIRESLAQAKRREFASDAEVEEALRRFEG